MFACLVALISALAATPAYADCYTITSDSLAFYATTLDSGETFSASSTYALSYYSQSDTDDVRYSYPDYLWSASVSSSSGYGSFIVLATTPIVPKGYYYLVVRSASSSSYFLNSSNGSLSRYWGTSYFYSSSSASGSSGFVSISDSLTKASSNIYGFVWQNSASLSSTGYWGVNPYCLTVVVFDDDATISDVLDSLDDVNGSLDDAVVLLGDIEVSLETCISYLESIDDELDTQTEKLTSINAFLSYIYSYLKTINSNIDSEAEDTRTTIVDCFDELYERLDEMYESVMSVSGSDTVANSVATSYTIETIVQTESSGVDILTVANDWVEVISSASESSTLTFPGISLELVGVTFSVPSYEVDIWNGMTSLHNACRTGCTIVAVLAFLRGVYGMVCKVFGLDFTQDSLATALDGDAGLDDLNAAYAGSKKRVVKRWNSGRGRLF